MITKISKNEKWKISEDWFEIVFWSFSLMDFFFTFYLMDFSSLKNYNPYKHMERLDGCKSKLSISFGLYHHTK